MNAAQQSSWMNTGLSGQTTSDVPANGTRESLESTMSEDDVPNSATQTICTQHK